MSFSKYLRALFALLAAGVIAFGVAACGDDDDDSGSEESSSETSSTAIESNPDNEGVEVTIGSKNFDEQFILGEIYAQALEAAGYTVETELNLGSEVVAKKALETGEVDAYPEYTSTTLTSLYGTAPEDVPGDAQEAADLANEELSADGLVAFAPTPFTSANAVGLLDRDGRGARCRDDLGPRGQVTGPDPVRHALSAASASTACSVSRRTTASSSGGSSPSTSNSATRFSTMATPTCRSCSRRTGPLYKDPETYTILEDDQSLLPAGNVIVTASQEAADAAGPDFQETIELVQEQLDLEVMQELNARVSLDREDPADVAADYLQQAGYTE